MTSKAFIAGCLGETLSPEEAAFLAGERPWGLILFARNCRTPDQIRSLVLAFREAVGRPDAPVLIDQEGGRVQRLKPPHWPTYAPGATFGRLAEADPAAGRRAAWLTARLIAADLTELGITVDCLPVLDVAAPGMHAVIGDRSYGSAPDRVATLGRDTAQALMEGGVLPVMKHIPGHGRAAADSHHALPVVDASAEALAVDCLPFRMLNDLPMAMTAHVVYRALDPDRPATTSPVIIGDVIRKSIGFDGLLMSDDLSMKALSGSFGERTEAALAAGCDVVLHCNGDIAEMRAIAAATPVLDGRAGERAAAALARLRPPGPLDRAAAREELDGLLAGAQVI